MAKEQYCHPSLDWVNVMDVNDDNDKQQLTMCLIHFSYCTTRGSPQPLQFRKTIGAAEKEAVSGKW